MTVLAATEHWLMTAKFQIDNLKKLERKLFFSYEQLTDNTTSTIQEIINFLPELEFLSPNSTFTARNVTGKPIKGLVNLNEPKINRLTSPQLKEINNILCKHTDILKTFGYELIER